MAVKLDHDEKVEILRQILPQFWNEAIHWREDSWRFTKWLVSILVGVAGISVFTDKGLLFAASILLALSIGGWLYLDKNYRSYCDRIELFVHVEEALLFFEDDIYVAGRSLLPKELLNKKVTWWKGQGIYMFIIGIVAVAAWASIIYQAAQK